MNMPGFSGAASLIRQADTTAWELRPVVRLPGPRRLWFLRSKCPRGQARGHGHHRFVARRGGLGVGQIQIYQTVVVCNFSLPTATLCALPHRMLCVCPPPPPPPPPPPVCTVDDNRQCYCIYPFLFPWPLPCIGGCSDPFKTSSTGTCTVSCRQEVGDESLCGVSPC